MMEDSKLTNDVTRYWFDTEFMEDGSTIKLISIGMVCEDGREFYAESQEADYTNANEWVKTHVIPHLWNQKISKREGNLWSRDGGTGGFLPRYAIKSSLLNFVYEVPGKPEFWTYYGDYDWVVLCQLFGRMIDLPEGWPMFAMDVKQLCISLGDPDLPEQNDTEHHALNDARWTKLAWEFLTKEKEQ
jgi:hypothetical protein